MVIFNGPKVAQIILDDLKSEVARLSFQPVFCDVLIGADPVSKSYVNTKAKKAQEIGLKFEMIQLPKNTSTAEVISEMERIQKNPELSGLIIQLPLPEQLDKDVILKIIDPKVDVDGLNGGNFIPPTAAAVLSVLESAPQDLSKTNVLVIGQGELVGKPVTALLKEKKLQVSIADDSTDNLSQLTMIADVIISATGHAKLINGDMIKSGVIIIDCGTSESAGSIVGDVDFESVATKASFVSPVPGGVGPLTVAMLLKNVVEVAKRKSHV